MAAVLGGGTFAREGERRVLALAVFASLALHAVLLFANFLQLDAARNPYAVPVPIVARLIAAPPPPATPSKPRAVEPPPPVKRQPVAPPVERLAPAGLAVQSKPESALPPREAAKREPEITLPAPPAAPASAPSAPGPIARIDTRPSPPSPAASDDAGTLDQYRLAIYSAARRYKKYPRVALDNNWEGKAVIRLVIGANGLIANISIKTSTGHDVLDQAALETLTRAKPLVPIPAALRGKEFGMDINFIFSLNDERA
ncbi:MAG: energy transducer TonB [Betaproteobacteria bacterium]|nr:energy transducer TonB [Betaproteobacteria bacterium]